MENSTNQNVINTNDEQSVITVTLRMNSENKEVLHFDGVSEDLDINFSNSNQTSLRKLFRWLLDKQLKQRAVLKLVKDPSVKNVTYQKVADDYIGDLNNEIDSIFTKEAKAIKDLTDLIEMEPSRE